MLGKHFSTNLVQIPNAFPDIFSFKKKKGKKEKTDKIKKKTSRALSPTLFSLWNPMRLQASVVISCTPVLLLIQTWNVLSFTVLLHAGLLVTWIPILSATSSAIQTLKHYSSEWSFLTLNPRFNAWWEAVKKITVRKLSKQKLKLDGYLYPFFPVSWKYALVLLVK